MKNTKKFHIIEGIAFGFICLIILVFIGFSIRAFAMQEPSQSISFVGQIIVMGYLLIIPFILFLLIFVISRWRQKKLGITRLIDWNKVGLTRGSFKRIGIMLGILLIITFIGIVTFQSKFLYFPSRNTYAESRLEGNELYEEVIISDSNETYYGWSKIDTETQRPTIIFYGGNAQISSSTFLHYDTKEWFEMDEYNFVMVDYPTYGKSTDKISEENIYDMALLTFDYVSEMDGVDPNNIIVMGFSLGTGVASYVASERDFQKLILLAPYTSMVDIINTRIPIFQGPLKGLIRHQYNTIDRINDIEEETLLIASIDDDIIPFKISDDLMNEFDDAETFTVRYSTHNTLLDNEEVNLKIKQFLNN